MAKTMADQWGLTDGERRDWAEVVGYRFANTVRRYREKLLQNGHSWYTQGNVAEAMRSEYRFSSWRQTTMTKVEILERELKLSEAYALAEILGLNLADAMRPPWDEYERGRAEMAERQAEAVRRLDERRARRKQG